MGVSMKSILFIFILGLSFTASAISERDVLTEMVNVLDKQKDSFYSIKYFETRLGLDSKSKNPFNVYYTKFGTKRGSKGSLVIVPGRTEGSLKYVEVATDFINQGYSPVYAIDHRGQGFTPTVTSKTLPDTTIGHIEVFDHYVRDFNTFVNEILKDSHLDKNNLYLVSNSMGGAIALRYFQKYPNNPFKKSALSGSMFKILTDEKFPLIKTTAICNAGFITSIFSDLDCYGYTPGEAPFRWVDKDRLPDGREINVRPFFSKGDRTLTSSKERYRLNDYVWNKWPNTIVGGPSLKWTEQALGATQTLRSIVEVKKVKNSVFLLVAKKDFRVDANTQTKLCRQMGSKCQIKSYDGFHELLMETDSIRDEAISDIINYFQ